MAGSCASRPTTVAARRHAGRSAPALAVAAYRQRVYHPDRLLHPLVRTGERGSGQFRQATWDEALEVVARGIERVSDRHGPQSLYIASGPATWGYCAATRSPADCSR